MSGMKYTGMALAVTLSAALIFSACGKKEKKDEQPVETDSVVEFSMDDSTEAIPAEIIPEIDPNESYAAQVQAELGDVEIPTTDITTKTAAVNVPALSQTMSTPDGNVQIKLKGIFKKDSEGNFVHRWVYFDRVSVNGEVMAKDVTAWHNKPHVIDAKVKKGQLLMIEAEWGIADFSKFDFLED